MPRMAPDSYTPVPLQVSRWPTLALLGAFCTVLFFHGLTLGEIYRTESLRAIIGAEFLRTGNWVVPMLYGEPLLTKPPVMYAAIAAASSPFGEVMEWTARLPSALAATMVILLFYWYVSRQTGRLGGLVAALITPCTYMWLDKATAAEIDMLQVFWVSAALLFFFRATEASDIIPGRQVDKLKNTDDASAHQLVTAPLNHRANFGWWLAALLCVAGGVLTKWTAGVFFYATAIPFLLWRRQFHLLFRPAHLLSACIGAAICCAWLAAVVHQVGWSAFAETFWQEAAPRLLPKYHVGNHIPYQAHWIETLEHPLKLLAANLPWSLFLLPTLMPGFLALWDERGRRLVQAFHCWTWPNILAWTLLPDHATRHSFPLFPGITALAAMTWIAMIERRLEPRWTTWLSRAGMGIIAGFGVGGAAALVILGATMAGVPIDLGRTTAAEALPPQIWWLVPIIAGGALWSATAGWDAYRDRRCAKLFAMLIVGWIMVKIAFVDVYVPVRNDSRQPRAKAEMLSQYVPQGQTLYLIQLKDEGIMFYYRRPVLRLRRWEDLPESRRPAYCIMTPFERKQLRAGAWEILEEQQLRDAQDDPLYLLALRRGEPPVRQARNQPLDRQ